MGCGGRFGSIYCGRGLSNVRENDTEAWNTSLEVYGKHGAGTTALVSEILHISVAAKTHVKVLEIWGHRRAETLGMTPLQEFPIAQDGLYDGTAVQVDLPPWSCDFYRSNFSDFKTSIRILLPIRGSGKQSPGQIVLVDFSFHTLYSWRKLRHDIRCGIAPWSCTDENKNYIPVLGGDFSDRARMILDCGNLLSAGVKQGGPSPSAASGTRGQALHDVRLYISVVE
jgi:hypothetical protein